MQNAEHVLEVVVFKVKPDYVAQLPDLRDALRKNLKDFPGFIAFSGYSPHGEGAYADLVKWRSHDDAQAAAQAVASGDARFAPYMSAIESVSFMGHLVPDA
jgi:heme-degrading monooxygenase HmoA